MKKGFIAVMVTLMLLVGCASKNDVQIAQSDKDAMVALAQSEQIRVASAGAAHEDTVKAIAASPEITGSEKILGLALISRDFTEVMKSKLDEIVAKYKRATLGTDVQVSVAKEVGKGIPIMTLGAVAINSDRQEKGDTIEASGGSSIDVNKEANHATSLGDGSPPTTSTQQGDTDVVFEPVEEETVTEIE